MKLIRGTVRRAVWPLALHEVSVASAWRFVPDLRLAFCLRLWKADKECQLRVISGIPGRGCGQ